MNILITGGASGLGASITKRLARDSADTIYFTYHRSADNAKNIEREFKNTKGIECNFLEPREVSYFCEQMRAFDLEALINNAFVTSIVKKHFHKIDSEDFVKCFVSNVVPTIRITQDAIGLFRKKKTGKIITILTSALSNKPPIGYSEYVAAKAYLASLSKSWAHENAGYNITSNCISPSFMQTNLTRDTDERVIEELLSSHPLHRLLTTDEVADAVAFLLRGSTQINGINLFINSAHDVV